MKKAFGFLLIVLLMVQFSSALRYTVLETSYDNLMEYITKTQNPIAIVGSEAGYGISGACNTCSLGVTGCRFCSKRPCRFGGPPSEFFICEVLNHKNWKVLTSAKVGDEFVLKSETSWIKFKVQDN